MKNKVCSKCKKEKSIKDFYYMFNKNRYRSECIKCTNKSNKKSSRTKEGVISKIYSSQKRTSIKRGHPMPAYSKKELKKWLYNNNFDAIYEDWKNSDYNILLKPSADRINNKIHYTFENIQLVTWGINHKNASKEKYNINCVPVIREKDGVFKEYKSISQAARENNLHVSNIVNVCKGIYKHSGGFIWKYKI